MVTNGVEFSSPMVFCRRKVTDGAIHGHGRRRVDDSGYIEPTEEVTVKPKGKNIIFHFPTARMTMKRCGKMFLKANGNAPAVA